MRDTSGALNAFRAKTPGQRKAKHRQAAQSQPNCSKENDHDPQSRQTLAVVALAVAAAGAQAASSVGARDPYTEGARAVQSAVDAYTEGARSSDSIRTVARSTDIYTDGARSANPYYDGAHA